MKKIAAFLLFLSFTVSVWSVSYASAGLNRINGKDRYEVSANLAYAGFKSASSVVLVNGSDTSLSEGLAAVPLAKALKAPVMLVNNGLSQDVLSQIKRLDPSNIYIVGETESIDGVIENAIGNNNVKYTLINGSDTYDVAQNIADMLKDIYGTINKAYVCYGGAVSDAALIAGVAAKSDAPLLYVTQNASDGQTQNTVNTMKSLGVQDVDVIGGSGSVPDVVLDDLMYNNGFNAVRVDGINREELSAAVASKYYTDPAEVLFINGYKYADCLEADSLSSEDYPVLYVKSDSKNITNGVKAYLKSQTQIDRSDICIVGGTASVSPEAESNIINSLAQ